MIMGHEVFWMQIAGYLALSILLPIAILYVMLALAEWYEYEKDGRSKITFNPSKQEQIMKKFRFARQMIVFGASLLILAFFLDFYRQP